VIQVDPRSLEVVGRYDVPGQPRELTVVDGGVAVTAAQATSLTVIDPTAPSGEAVTAIPIPCGGSRGVVAVPARTGSRGGDHVVVTCPTDDRLVVVDTRHHTAVGMVPLAGRPTGIVRGGTTLTVGTALDGRLRTFDARALVRAADDAGAGGGAAASASPPPLRVKATSKRRAWADDGRAPSTLAALDVGPRGPVGVYQVIDNQRELTRAEIEAGSTYGSPKDGRARLEPALTGPCGARFASLTDAPRRLSGPVAVAASSDDDLVWVVGEFSHSVSVVRCDGAASSEQAVTVAAFDVGEGARGIVLGVDGRTAYVDVGFDHEVARLELPDGAASVQADDAIERPRCIRRKDRATHRRRFENPLPQQRAEIPAAGPADHFRQKTEIAVAVEIA